MACGLAALLASVLLASTCSVLTEASSAPPVFPDPLRAAGFGFTLARITVRSSRTRFAGRLNSGDMPHLGGASSPLHYAMTRLWGEMTKLSRAMTKKQASPAEFRASAPKKNASSWHKRTPTASMGPT